MESILYFKMSTHNQTTTFFIYHHVHRLEQSGFGEPFICLIVVSSEVTHITSAAVVAELQAVDSIQGDNGRCLRNTVSLIIPS